MVGNAKGYTSVIVMPETQSQEKKDVLRIFGADLRLVPANPTRPWKLRPVFGNTCQGTGGNTSKRCHLGKSVRQYRQLYGALPHDWS